MFRPAVALLPWSLLTLLAHAGWSAEPVAPPLSPPVLVEAESCATTGSISEASTTLHTPGAEASGRRYVTLPPGATLTLNAPLAASSLVLRCSYPDTAQGGGEDGVLRLSIAGEMHEVRVTSRFSWEYGKGRFNSPDVWPSDPALGLPRHFWDETALRFPAVAAGAALTLENPAAQQRTVLLDCVEWELVPEACPRPAGSLSFADWRPDNTGVADVTELLQQALLAAEQKHVALYVPDGTYLIDSVEVRSAPLQGAGMWRTRFIGPLSRFRFTGATTRLADFAILGATAVRNDHSDADNGFAGKPGTGTRIERVWVEHKKCAFWVAPGGDKSPVDGLTISDCRFRDLMADGVNLYNGASNCVIERCRVRGTGDDGLACWSPAQRGTPGANNVFRDNTVQCPWLASGIALYGGGPFTVSGNTISDTVTTGSGIYVSANFKAWPFAGEIRVTDNTLLRCGAHESDAGSPTGAIRVLAWDGDMTDATFIFARNRIIAPVESAISIHGPHTVTHLSFDACVAEDLGAAVLVDIRPGAKGEAEFSAMAPAGAIPNAPLAAGSDPWWRMPADSQFRMLRK